MRLSLNHKALPAAAILLLSLVITAVPYWLIIHWEPALSYDTGNYYYTAQDIVRKKDLQWDEFLLAPFYREPSSERVQAHESKPFFVIALRLWGWLVRLFKPQAAMPAATEYLLFMASCCWLVFIMVWRLGKSVGQELYGVVAGVITLISPWHLVLLYYPAYTQLSIAMLLGAIILLAARTPHATLLAGVLATAALLTNNATVVYLIGISLLVIYISAPDWRRGFLLAGIFIVTVSGIFTLLKLLSFAPLVQNLFRTPQIDSPIETLTRYYYRSVFENHFSKLDIPKYVGVMLLFLTYNSKVMTTLFVATPFIFVWQLAKQGVSALIHQTRLRQIALVALPAVVGMLAIDLRPGVQLGRTYFIGYPLLVLAALILFSEALKNIRYRQAVIAIFAVAYVAENIYALYDQRQAFHEAGIFITAISKTGQRIAIFEQDKHLIPIVTNAEMECQCVSSNQFLILKSSADKSQLQNLDQVYLVTGPETETIYPAENMQTIPIPQLLNSLQQAGVQTELKQILPYWTLYPLLVFEDETQMWRLITREFGPNDYREGSGAVKVWLLKTQMK